MQQRANPIFIIENELNGNIRIECLWGEPRTEEEAHAISRELANTIFLLNYGEMLPTLMQSVAVAGREQNMDGIANAALGILQHAINVRSNLDNAKKLVVPPEQAFREDHGGPNHD